MGLFGNSKIKEFKNKFVQVYNSLSRVSYGEIPRNSGLHQIELEYDIFIAIAKSFNDPFTEYFNMYASTTTLMGTKTSVAEAIVIIFLARKAVLEGMYLSKGVQLKIFSDAKDICASFQGRDAVQEILNA